MTRSILFEELDSKYHNLFSIVFPKEEQLSLSDDDIADITKHLVVHGFEETLSKFHPIVEINYPVAFQEKLGTEMRFNMKLEQDTSILFQIIHMINKKHQYLEQQNPVKNILEDSLFYMDQQDFLLQRHRFLTALEEGREDVACKTICDMVNKLPNDVFLIKCICEELEKQIEQVLDRNSNRFLWKDSEINEVQTIAVSEKFRNQYQYEPYIKEKVDRILERLELNNTTIWATFLGIPLNESKDMTDMDLVIQYEKYQSELQKIYHEVWKQSIPLVETYLGIWSYFEQLKGRNEEGDLLITNCKVSECMLPQRRQFIDVFLRTVNQKQYEKEKIHFAIFQNMPYQEVEIEGIRQRFKGTDTIENSKVVDVEDARILTEMLEQFGIISLLSTRSHSKNTSYYLSKYGVDKWQEQFGYLEERDYTDSAFATWPNICIFSKDCTQVMLRDNYQYDVIGHQIRKDNSYEYLEEIHIQSSYLIAGLLEHKSKMQEQKTISITGLLPEVFSYPTKLYEQITNQEPYNLMRKSYVIGPFNGKLSILNYR